MLPSRHIFFGSIIAFLSYFTFSQTGMTEALIFLASTFLIDVDHYIYYVLVKKNWSLPKAYRWYRIKRSYWLNLSRPEKNKHRGVILLFHGIEVLAIVFILGIFVHHWFFYIFLGFLFHLFLDILEMQQHQDRIDKISVIHDYIKFRKLEKTFN